MDFTLEQYNQLISALKCHHRYLIQHDIDQYPERALSVAEIESNYGVTTTYYIRAQHFFSHSNLIRHLASMGHSIGYHYENLAITHGNLERAYNDFCINLELLRTIVPVNTACAHGSPVSQWDNKELWAHYDIHSLGIEYEPMLDTDFSKTLYLTDTGRRWDGYKVSVRDKVPQYQEQWTKEGLAFHTTDDIIHVLNNQQHPIHQKALLINTHPQRWLPFGIQWALETGVQWWKNQAKRLLVISTAKNR